MCEAKATIVNQVPSWHYVYAEVKYLSKYTSLIGLS